MVEQTLEGMRKFQITLSQADDGLLALLARDMPTTFRMNSSTLKMMKTVPNEVAPNVVPSNLKPSGSGPLLGSHLLEQLHDELLLMRQNLHLNLK